MSDSKGYVAQWRADLASGLLGLRLVGTEHPLVILAGANDLGLPRIVLQSSIKPKEPMLSDLILVRRAVDAAGEWSLTMTLQDLRFTEVFIRLTDDVVTRSMSSATAAAAWRVIDDVFDEWRRLLRPRPLGVLSLEELRGLIGELWLLIHELTEHRPIDQAIAGWLGPLGAPQDFWFEHPGFLESKAIGADAKTVKISSAEQLDQDLDLAVIRLPEVSEGTEGSINLPTMVAMVRDALDDLSEDHNEFDLRLDRYGVDLTHPYYAEKWFTVSQIEHYAVEDEFPRVRATRLLPGVQNVKYQIALASILPYQTSSEALH